jgi:biopolymer transport protein ExbD
MPKIKVKKGSVSLDMTAMCDVSFLLLTFFVLTAKAKPLEPVEVSTPASVVEMPIKDVDVITILLDQEGRSFIGMDNSNNARENWLSNIQAQYKLELNDEQRKNFINGGMIGVPAQNLAQFLSADGPAKKAMETETKGIPVDTSNTETNQLKDWIINARKANLKASIVIKADSKTPYYAVKSVMKTLVNQNVNEFSFLTSLEGKN